jgi:hypothetical protein
VADEDLVVAAADEDLEVAAVADEDLEVAAVADEGLVVVVVDEGLVVVVDTGAEVVDTGAEVEDHGVVVVALIGVTMVVMVVMVVMVDHTIHGMHQIIILMLSQSLFRLMFNHPVSHNPIQITDLVFVNLLIRKNSKSLTIVQQEHFRNVLVLINVNVPFRR